ncbi:uncharacterized protein LOC131648533 [Vicia villosa]|uniref:uncharacterized protein LOC131648533 n=1 Tax=Vicia villosa TaxID=3911 RepID=UPI00273C956C|nr:uncharacterized protein LOC131648533 [Vicia villosa]
MVWNCRGAASKSFYRYCKHYMDMYHSSMLVILETRCDPKLLDKTFEKLDFDKNMFVENRGYSGSIVVEWKSSYFEINLCKKDDQFLHLHIKDNDKQDFFFTAVYASPHENKKKLLWEMLNDISIRKQHLWLVAGDFNDIAKSFEKRGGLQASNNRCTTFRNRIQSCLLEDIESRGPNFTWRGPIFHEGQRIYENMDRALSNDSWRWRFSNA